MSNASIFNTYNDLFLNIFEIGTYCSNFKCVTTSSRKICAVAIFLFTVNIIIDKKDICNYTDLQSSEYKSCYLYKLCRRRYNTLFI